LKTLKGIGASRGYAVSKIYFLEPLDLTVKEQNSDNQAIEMKRFIDAQNEAVEELDLLYEKTKINNLETAKVFEIHQMLLTDLDFTEKVQGLIESGKTAEYAVYSSAMSFKSLFEEMDDEVFQARGADILDINNRLIRILKGIEDINELPTGKFILVSEDILPSDIVRFDTDYIDGFVTKSGSMTSHAVILARTLNIPIVIGVSDFDQLPHQGTIAINGETGKLFIQPDKKTIKLFKEKIEEELVYRKTLQKYKGQAISKSGHKIVIAANIGNINDIDLVIENDADAVGLFRSEFIYLESRNYPSEEKQFSIYKEVVSKLAPRNVIVRTLDIGADKTVDYFNLEKEENPALGYRAIRICLNEPHIFKTQLRALYRASKFGDLSIMFPMITHLEQVIKIKEIIEEIKNELRSKDIEFNENIKLGIMIETPSAVMISDELAKMVDFFSIGTNDLTQYTMAVDRMNSKILDLFDQSHQSILKMISMTAKNAHDAGIWVGICGESASDLSLLDFYIENKIDELSVTPANVLVLKKEISNR